MSAGVVPPGNEHLVLDPKKIHRARENIMKELREEHETDMEESDLTCLMVDARIDNTKNRRYNEETKRFYNSIEKEEHYTLTDEKGKYLTHFTKEQVPEDSSLTPSENIAILIYNWCVEYGADKTLLFKAGNSTVSNNYYNGGLLFL